MITGFDKASINRRRFLGGTAAGLASSQLGSLAASQPVSPPKLFDMHVHLAHAWYGTDRGPLTAEMLIRWMDVHNIEQAAVLPLVSPEAFWYPISTDTVIKESREYPDRLIPFCGIDPRTLATHLTTHVQVVDLLRRYQDAGVRGFGEHKALLPIDDPLNMKLYAACSEVGFPVLFHLDNRANMDKPGLPGLEKILQTWPDLRMIGHGKGWWASIAGNLRQADLHVGYPKGRVATGGALDRLLKKYPNLYGDLSSSGAHALLRDPEFGVDFLKRNHKQLLFGTDYYDLTQKDFLQFSLFRQLQVDADIRTAICWNNARQLLKAV
jgi:uncharacterized protein